MAKRATSEKVPSHIALIPDGNRRWARSHKFNLFNGYNLGVKKFVRFSIWAKGLGVKMLTVWALSSENLRNRSKEELSVLFRIYVKAARDPSILRMLKDNQTRVNIIGNLRSLPVEVRKALLELHKKTKDYKDFTINLLIGYGGKDDIVHAARRILNKYRNRNIDISAEEIERSLITNEVPDVDLVIRTSGEMRTSGLMPWQIAYSELYFSKKYWPDFEKADLVEAVQDYSSRERRFGK
ncbi:MAG: polyprenyl diphosphate synthase [Candidatus Micrarchaeia archaeon]